MRKLLTSLVLVLMAMSASAQTYDYALSIGGVRLNSINTASSETLTSQLKTSGVLKSGTVGFERVEQNGLLKGILTLTGETIRQAGYSYYVCACCRG
jgi:hypothetical protein